MSSPEIETGLRRLSSEYSKTNFYIQVLSGLQWGVAIQWGNTGHLFFIPVMSKKIEVYRF